MEKTSLILNKIESKVALTFTEKQEVQKILKSLVLINRINHNLEVLLEKILVQDLPRKRKVFLIKQFLQQIRFPKFSSRQKKLIQTMEKIEKTNKLVSFNKNIDFEKNYLDINIKFSNFNDLTKVYNSLKQQKKEIEKLTALLKGK